MNLFILAMNPIENVSYYFDQHVVKILLEAIQLLCIAFRLLASPELVDASPQPVYRLTHKNHPVAIWVRASRAHFLWTLDMVDALHQEWRLRYGHTKTHKGYPLCEYFRSTCSQLDFPSEKMGAFAQAMPEKYRDKECAIRAYRAYYQGEEKQGLRKWRAPRGIPAWFEG
jgi:hypothetical protein